MRPNPEVSQLATAGERYYVYALSTVPVGETFDPNSIFYVGKGTGKRWENHFKEAQRQFSQDENGEPPELSAKFRALREILQACESHHDFENYVYIVKGGLPEKSALQLEALTIELLLSMGVELSNLVRGHHSADLLKPAAEVRRYYGAEPMFVDWIRADSITDFLAGGPRGEDTLFLAMKGSTEDMAYLEDVDWEDAVTGEADNIDGVHRVLARPDPEKIRRGWNPEDPWTDEEARERARHYWTISAEKLRTLQQIALDERLELVLLIRDPRAGQTAIRYHWQVEGEGEWLEYGTYEGETWRREQVGIPLGAAFEEKEDALLGHIPYNRRNERHIFNGPQGGHTYFALPANEEPDVALD